MAEQLIAHLDDDDNSYEILTNPLNTTLLCLVSEDLNGVFPASRIKLYMEMVECMLRRNGIKLQLPENGEDLGELTKADWNNLV